MSFNDYVGAWLASACYYGGDKETFDKQVPAGWRKVECSENPETGFVCMLFVKESSSGKGGDSVFAVMGTNSSAGSEIAKGQLKSNSKLREDPADDGLDIVSDCIKFVRDQTWKLENNGGNWNHHIVGHSLGGYTATCATVALADTIERCVTFESPGVSKYWREKAKSKSEAYWKKLIVEYMSFPNPINTCLPHIGSVKRLHMQCQSSSSPGHVIRCVVGSSLRFIVWVSVANVAFAALGRAEGFWAAKLGSVVVKVAKTLFRREFSPKKIKQAVKDGLSDDQASRDTRSAKEGKVDDPSAKPLKPILRAMPADARPAFIVGFWALAMAAFANTGYLSMRTLAQVNDCMAEHNVDSIAEHFDEKTGGPKKATDMKSWPFHEIMVKKGLMGEHTRRCYLEALTPFHPTAYGMHNLLNREKTIYKRASTMPGFQEA